MKAPSESTKLLSKEGSQTAETLQPVVPENTKTVLTFNLEQPSVTSLAQSQSQGVAVAEKRSAPTLAIFPQSADKSKLGKGIRRGSGKLTDEPSAGELSLPAAVKSGQGSMLSVLFRGEIESESPMIVKASEPASTVLQSKIAAAEDTESDVKTSQEKPRASNRFARRVRQRTSQQSYNSNTLRMFEAWFESGMQIVYDKFRQHFQRSVLIQTCLILLVYLLLRLILAYFDISGVYSSKAPWWLFAVQYVYFAMAIIVVLVSAYFITEPRHYFRLMPFIFPSLVGVFSSLVYVDSIGLCDSTVSGMCVTHSGNTSALSLVIFITYAVLTTSKVVGSVLGWSLALVDLIYIGLAYYTYHATIPYSGLASTLLVYMAANCLGLLYLSLVDASYFSIFTVTWESIEEELKLEQEEAVRSEMRDVILNRVIPKQIAQKFQTVMETKMGKHGDIRAAANFQEMFMDFHDDVSVLFADIVNFTPLTSSLSPFALIVVLNDLYGKFDILAEQQNCHRIKILGDCYYCVSGLYQNCEEHAKNCTVMGLLMIKTIRMVRKHAALEKLDMRIGIDSGSVFSGIVGMLKWQFDIWSDHVTIANKMESTGKAGRVHVTKAVVDKLEGEFKVEKTEKIAIMPNVEEETYFIADEELENVSLSPFMTTKSKNLGKEQTTVDVPFQNLAKLLVYNKLPIKAETSRKLLEKFNVMLPAREAPKSLLAHWKDLWAVTEGLNPLSLRFMPKVEDIYVDEMDLTLSVSCGFGIVLLALMSASHDTIGLSNWQSAVTLIVGLVVFVILLILVSGLSVPPCINFHLPVKIKDRLLLVSHKLLRKMWSTLVFGLMAIVLFAASVLFMYNPCTMTQSPVFCNLSSSLTPNVVCNSSNAGAIYHEPCNYAPNGFAWAHIVCMFGCTFFKVNHVIKLLFSLLCMLVFYLTMTFAYHPLFTCYDLLVSRQSLPYLRRLLWQSALVIVMLFCINRKLETRLRQNFIIKHAIANEKRKCERTKIINEALLNNVLPQHVTGYYLTPGRMASGKIYHRHCHNACVIFASIPELKKDMSQMWNTGKDCINHLHKIISRFDKLLAKEFSAVEKIKTMGCSYMAAAGLLDEKTAEDPKVAQRSALLICQFAMAMMDQVKAYNKKVMFDYKLRVGLCHGELIAGVVGAMMPQYDIWGDTVNVASRMESNGTPGRIQFPEKTALVLDAAGIPSEWKATVNVKGKGNMEVYQVIRDATLEA